MRIINLINLVKEELKNFGIEVANDEVYFNEFIKVNSDEYTGILYKKDVIENGIRLDVGIGDIHIKGEEKSKIYVVCGNQDRILYSISIGTIENIKVCIEVMKKF